MNQTPTIKVNCPENRVNCIFPRNIVGELPFSQIFFRRGTDEGFIRRVVPDPSDAIIRLAERVALNRRDHHLGPGKQCGKALLRIAPFLNQHLIGTGRTTACKECELPLVYHNRTQHGVARHMVLQDIWYGVARR